MGSQPASKTDKAPQPQISPPTGKAVEPISATNAVLQFQRTIGNQGVLRLLDTAGLRVSQPGDRFEREADRVADRVMGASSHTLDPVAGAAGVDRHGGQTLSAKPMRGRAPLAAPRVQAGIGSLHGGGKPLEAATRSFMEPRFGFDFSNVRIHADGRSADMARKFNARAMAIGPDVVFGRGEYRPMSSEGKRLLAHELTHVIQQGGAVEWGPGAAVAKPVARVPASVIPRLRDIGDSYSEADLQAYLAGLTARGAIEDYLNSDNKARTIVAAWRHGGSPYALTTLHKVLLIKEMQSGATFDDDEWGILEILERSDNAELSAIFSAISASGLNSDFHGSEWDELKNFYSRRFSGGMADVLAGTIVPIGSPFPMGLDLSLTEGLRAPSAADKARVAEAISTEVKTIGGAPPVFDRIIGSHPDPWEVRIENLLNSVISSMHASMVVARPPRIAANMLPDADINRVAGLAQVETNKVYGEYYGSRPAFAVGTNIFDAFVQRDTTIGASATNADWAANFRVLKLLNGDEEIAKINKEHGAIHTRASEWALVAGVTGFPVGVVLTEAVNNAAPPHVTTGVVGLRRAELLDIHRNWSAFAGSGRIFLDRMKAATDEKNRDRMYRLFGTVIHEYVHTLEHPAHKAYRGTLDARQGGFVLREGMTEYLAKRVWDRVTFDSTMRASIEGAFQDPINPDSHSRQLPPRYPEWENGERVAKIVGIRKVLAAFFLGRVELIGKS